MIIGTQIMVRRTKAGLSQNQLSRLIGCGQSHLSYIESGGRQPSFGMAERLLDACGAELVVRQKPKEKDDG